MVGRQAPEALEVIEQAARAVGAPMRLIDRDFSLTESQPGVLTYRGMRTAVNNLRLGLKGRHQVDNAAVALASLELLEDRGLPLSQPNARTGLQYARWPGRLEEVAKGPLVVLDGAHNPMGVEALVKALDEVYPKRKVHLVFSVLEDKAFAPMIRLLFPRCAAVYLTPTSSPRSLHPDRYVGEAAASGAKVSSYPRPSLALEAARAAATGPDDLVLCAGSLVLIGEVKAALG